MRDARERIIGAMLVVGMLVACVAYVAVAIAANNH